MSNDAQIIESNIDRRGWLPSPPLSLSFVSPARQSPQAGFPDPPLLLILTSKSFLYSPHSPTPQILPAPPAQFNARLLPAAFQLHFLGKHRPAAPPILERTRSCGTNWADQDEAKRVELLTRYAMPELEQGTTPDKPWVTPV